MDSSRMILCHDIDGDAHIVRRSELVSRTSVYGVISGEEGVLHTSGNDEDVAEARYFTEPFSPDIVTPVARRVIGLATLC